jgi:hypothetical protein
VCLNSVCQVRRPSELALAKLAACSRALFDACRKFRTDEVEISTAVRPGHENDSAVGGGGYWQQWQSL